MRSWLLRSGVKFVVFRSKNKKKTRDCVDWKIGSDRTVSESVLETVQNI